MDISEINSGGSGFGEFEGASSGLIGDEDFQEAGAALEPGTSAAILVWENRWAAPVAIALRKSGGQLVASGRIPVQAIIAALDAVEAVSKEESMPGLIRGVARTAAIAGTATAVSNRVSRRQANRWSAEEAPRKTSSSSMRSPSRSIAPPPPAAPGPGPGPDRAAQEVRRAARRRDSDRGGVRRRESQDPEQYVIS